MGYAAEQAARDMLDRMGVPNAQEYTAGNVCELANLLAPVFEGKPATKGYRIDLEAVRAADPVEPYPPTGEAGQQYSQDIYDTLADDLYQRSPMAPGLDEKLTDIIELLALIADGSAHRGANEGRIREIKQRYGFDVR